jgi:phosphatidylserine/phosphatidylglycerophosphate/cardiolipin synthase-like enzyme
MSTAYELSPLRKLAGSGGKTSDYWRDTDLQIEGPAVAQLQALFLQHWFSQCLYGNKASHVSRLA